MTCGILNVYKEAGMTSFHAVAVIRRLTGEKKVGHTGTLDPDATGVLPICIGKATKLVGMLTDTDKEYKAVMKLGIKTDTQDISGTVIEKLDDSSIRNIIDDEKIKEAFKTLTGNILQVPPMYSALKVNGVKLVDAARKGRTIERNPRPVTVYSYSGLNIDYDNLEITFRIKCSKGTYVRTICEDIGSLLGVPSCLKSLQRTSAAGFNISDSITLKQAEYYASSGILERYIIPVDSLLLAYPYLIVSKDSRPLLASGNHLYKDDFDLSDPHDSISGEKGGMLNEGTYRIYSYDGTFYALYDFDNVNGYYKCRKMFY